jgi:hypothetical protein
VSSIFFLVSGSGQPSLGTSPGRTAGRKKQPKSHPRYYLAPRAITLWFQNIDGPCAVSACTARMTDLVILAGVSHDIAIFTNANNVTSIPFDGVRISYAIPCEDQRLIQGERLP